jgi:hypothetical protein
MKQKKEFAVLVVLLVIAGSIWYWFFFRQDSAAPANFASDGISYTPLGVDNPAPVTDPLDRARKTEYSSSGRNIFSRDVPPKPPTQQELKKIEELKREQASAPPPPPPPPVAAPLPVKYFGFGVVPNGTARRAFFNDSEDVYIVSEGELLLNKFRILKIGNSSLEYEDISNGLHNTVPLEDAPPPAATQ